MSLYSELEDLGELMATNISAKGVTASASDGLTTLAGKIAQIQTGGGATNIVQGTFTTGSTRASTGTVSLNYTGNGYPIAIMVFIDGGAYNNGSGGNTTWYNLVRRYDVGAYYMTKARITTTPTYATSGADNYGVAAIIYKNSTSSSTSYTRTSSMSANSFTSSSGNPATSYNCVKMKGNKTTLAYYVGNNSSSTIGLTPGTTYAYIIIYSE